LLYLHCGKFYEATILDNFLRRFSYERRMADTFSEVITLDSTLGARRF
jgi:hypothetical protein